MGTVGVLGSLNIDLGLRVPRLPRPGETTLAADRSRAFGGKGGNQAIAAAACGADVAFVGAVGVDDDGVAYRSHLASWGIDIEGVVACKDHPTGTAIVLVDEGGENLIVVDPGANAAVSGDRAVADVLSAAPDVLLLQLEIPVAAMARVVAAIPDSTTVILNPAPMPPDAEALAPLLARADILVPNRGELAALTGRPEPVTTDGVTACLAHLAANTTVIVTLGADGAALRVAGGDVVFLPAPRVRAVDTTGAGDAFCGCLAAGIAQGSSVRDAAARALAVASASTTVVGAQLQQQVRVS